MIDTLPDHIRKPHLRPIHPIPLQKDGKTFVALRDPAMLSQQTMIVPAQLMQVLQMFRGDRSVEELAAQLRTDVAQFVELAKGLDRLGLLWGPTSEELEKQQLDRIRAEGAFPVNAAMSLGQTEQACREKIDSYFAESEDPELDGAPIGIVAPHLDYERGWPNYASAYFPLRNAEAPDRVVILGTNHFGIGDGVVLSEFGFNSPLGQCPTDQAIVQSLVRELGRPLIVDQLDHLAEHSVQLHIPWLVHCFGTVPVVAALIPDPLSPMLQEDGARTKTPEFVDCLSSALKHAGGNTLFVVSSDLSHVGPQFGEPRPVDEQRRFDVERHDRDMMSKFMGCDAEEFLSAMRWNKNPTRWCSIGNMTAALMLAKPQTVELIDYRQAYDDQGMALVSSAAMALIG